MATTQKNIDITSLFEMNIGVPSKTAPNDMYEVLTQAYIFTDNEQIEVRFLDKEMAQFDFTVKNPDEFCLKMSEILVTSCLPENFKGEHLKKLFKEEYKSPKRKFAHKKSQELMISFDIVHDVSHNMQHVISNIFL